LFLILESESDAELQTDGHNIST